MLIIVCGLQGTGKTYVARKIAERTQAVLLRTDVIRKEILQVTSYTGQEVQDIYREMFSRAERLLQDHKNVVLDATFARVVNRSSARDLSISTEADFSIVEVVCADPVVEKRLKGRYGDESDAGFDVYLKCKPLFEPIAESHIVIDNSGTKEETDDQVNTSII
ncbi:MAG: AAA family ATPase [Bacteroidetes bacterium]|nr:AAA family ATPase [Bacteroidota bacterium]